MHGPWGNKLPTTRAHKMENVYIIILSYTKTNQFDQRTDIQLIIEEGMER